MRHCSKFIYIRPLDEQSNVSGGGFWRDVKNQRLFLENLRKDLGIRDVTHTLKTQTLIFVSISFQDGTISQGIKLQREAGR